MTTTAPLPPATAVPARPRRRGLLVAVTAVITALLTVGVVLSVQQLAQPERVAVAGTMTVFPTSTYSRNVSHDANTCTGTGAYGDLTPGTNAILKDAAGKVLGVSNLGPGSWASTSLTDASCTFGFRFDDVALEGDMFTVSVGTNSQRGDVPFTRQALTTTGATLELRERW
jgi:hypothetical protein